MFLYCAVQSCVASYETILRFMTSSCAVLFSIDYCRDNTAFFDSSLFPMVHTVQSEFILYLMKWHSLRERFPNTELLFLVHISLYQSEYRES